MIARYTRPELGAAWTDERRMAAWLEVELAATDAWAAVRASFGWLRHRKMKAITFCASAELGSKARAIDPCSWAAA